MKKPLSPSVPMEEVFRPPRTRKEKFWEAEAQATVGLAVQINKARMRARLTQGQLAKKIGTTQTVVSRIETANQNMTIETLVKIAQALKLEFVPILARKSQLPRIAKAVKEVKA